MKSDPPTEVLRLAPAGPTHPKLAVIAPTGLIGDIFHRRDLLPPAPLLLEGYIRIQFHPIFPLILHMSSLCVTLTPSFYFLRL